MVLRTYQETLDFIYSFLDPARKPAASVDEAMANLRRMDALLALAGQPQAQMPAVVIAGTKGKGSTAAMIEAIVRASGLRVGLFTSPHLNSYRERIQVDRELISQGDLVALTEAVRPLLVAFDSQPNGRPSVFDVGLLLALCYFAAHKVDLAVLEVGMGGRFDAVNVITPLVSVISSLSYDHMSILGNDLAEIAWNKAGIIKPGVPVVTVPQVPPADAVLVDEAHTQGAPLWCAAPHGLVALPHNSVVRAYPVAPQSALRGGFQQENARLALGVALLLRDAGLQLPDEVLAQGLAKVRWPGRFELVPGTPPVLIDGAHNGDSARKLAEAISAEVPYSRMILVLGISRDKDIDTMAAALVARADALVLTRSSHLRAMDLDRMVGAVGPYLRGALVVTSDVRAAIEAARGLAHPHDLIVVTGSLFVVAAARAALGLAVSD